MNIYTATCILYSRKAPEQEDPKTFLMHVSMCSKNTNLVPVVKSRDLVRISKSSVRN